MKDILFKTDNETFSYRVAGICVNKGKILLQKLIGEDAYSFPGGHVGFGETAEETLRREFIEETGAEIKVEGLRWVAEIFIPQGKRRMHQLCFYYNVKLAQNADIPRDGSFLANEELSGRRFKIEFEWKPIKDVPKLEIYPTNARELLMKPSSEIVHFVYREE